ncbi:hypothetical protein [Streptomyces sp. NPDC058240]|uniref:hypothetical protein n=1 Tax=Streptomyces sp. NPDC058240 TaxID=3346396 RepID=UPI0036E9C09B
MFANTKLPIARSPTTPRPTSTPVFLDLQQDCIPRVLFLLPYRAQAPAQGTNPVDADHEQQHARDEPDGSGVRDETVQVQQVRKTRRLFGDLVLEFPELVLAQQLGLSVIRLAAS